MGKKKNKINKINEEQYLQYIAGLKSDAPVVNTDGSLLVPDVFKESEKNKKENA